MAADPVKAKANKKSDVDLQSEVEYRTKLQEICNKLYAAKNLDDILINLRDEITGLFEDRS